MKRFDTVKMDGLNMTEQELDRRLESEAHLQIRQAVQAMPEDSVSMAWRSQLNEALVQKIEAKQRKRRFTWILSPALGLGMAGALAFVLMTKTPDISVNSSSFANRPNLEESLIASHRDTVDYTDITGVGLNPDEVVSKRSNAASYDYNEVDLGSL
jgi:hypothetical protein